MNDSLLDAARNALGACLALQPGETMLVLTDSQIRPIGEAFFEAARSLGALACIMEIPVAAASGAE
ncbi:MAG: aminopeptidase, partial [Polyangia bacterium]|nr:aminopeptidase [Polyangia bacterium]